MASDREAPTRPDAAFLTGRPLPGPPRRPDRLPRPSLSAAPYLLLPQLQNRPPYSLPPASPQSCFPAPRAPWPATLFPGTIFVSLLPAASLSPHLLPSPGPSRMQQTTWGWGSGAPPAPCHLSRLSLTHRSWVHNLPAVCPQPPLPSRAACRPHLLPHPLCPKGGSPATRSGSHGTSWESGDPAGVLAPWLFLGGISPRRPFLWIGR